MVPASASSPRPAGVVVSRKDTENSIQLAGHAHTGLWSSGSHAPTCSVPRGSVPRGPGCGRHGYAVACAYRQPWEFRPAGQRPARFERSALGSAGHRGVSGFGIPDRRGRIGREAPAGPPRAPGAGAQLAFSLPCRSSSPARRCSLLPGVALQSGAVFSMPRADKNGCIVQPF